MKNFKLKPDEIKHLLDWSSPDGCRATDDILIDGKKVGYMYREYPIDQYDSGWRFFSSEDDKNSSLDTYKLNTICNYDQDIIRYMDSEYYSCYVRENDKFVKKDISFNRKDIIDDFELTDFDYLKIRTNHNYFKNAYDNFIHLIDKLNCQFKLIKINKNKYIFDNQAQSFLNCFTSFSYTKGTLTFKIYNSLKGLKEFIMGSSDNKFSKVEIEMIELMLNLILFELSLDLNPNSNDKNNERTLKSKLFNYTFNVKQNIEYGNISNNVSIKNFINQNMYLENMIFNDFIKLGPFSENIILKYKNKIPETLIYIWRTKGLGSFYNNYFKIINPDEYINIISNKLIPIFVTGFGEIISINKYNEIILVDNNKEKVISDNIDDFFFDLDSKKFVEKYFNITKFTSLNSIRGQLSYDKMYDAKLNIKSLDELKD